VTMVPARRAREERRLLGELLLEAGIVTPEGLRVGLEAQRLSGGRLGCHLVRLGSVVPASLHLYLGEYLEALRPDLVRDVREGAAAGAIPARLAHHYGLVPVRASDGVLDLAVASPDALALKPAIEVLTGLKVEPIICPPALIAEGLDRFYPGEVEPGLVFRGAGDHVLVLADPVRGVSPEAPDRLAPGAPPSAWLRAILAEAVRCRSRRAEIMPRADRTEIFLAGREERALAHTLPRGPYAGIAALIEGLARIAARGRILPRDGRFTLLLGGKRVIVSVLALPGLQGYSYLLDLREETVVPRPPAEYASALPGFTEILDRMASERRGLIVLAGTDPPEITTGLDLLLALLGDRLPRRAVAAGWQSARWPGLADSDHRPDLIATRWPADPMDLASLMGEARERVVVAAIDAVDAFDAVRKVARRGADAGPIAVSAGVLAVRHLEALCQACRVGFDLADVLAGVPQPRALPGDEFWTSPGCAACRGSGALSLEAVSEFLPMEACPPPRPAGLRARRPGEERALQGRGAMLQASVRAAAEARIDVKEALRLLHERR